MSDPNRDDSSPKQPVPEGVNLLGTPERVRENTDADRKRYAVGPFGQAWLWTIGIILSVTGLYKVIAGPLLASALPTTKGVVLGWITIPARTITYAPKIAYEVDGKTYHFVAGTVVSTLTDAPETVPVSYVPFSPSSAIWNGGEWWFVFRDVYLMVVLILGLILVVVAIYQWRIRGSWRPSSPEAGMRMHRLLIWLGVIVAVAGFAWLISGYAEPASWFIPPDPNALAAFVAAIGVALLVTGLHYRKAARLTPAPG
ncbi:hypothetical protein [Humibacter sp. RRB41]|uniref:hypothetical protein n=1 Tax=Humibacter sp. RRB41 TaxID=2919946 RepID=UPI001FAA2F72|nr:hypothetical protein [Humibacter sp. RRB41]